MKNIIIFFDSYFYKFLCVKDAEINNYLQLLFCEILFKVKVCNKLCNLLERIVGCMELT